MAQQEVSLTQPLGRLVHIPLLGPPLSNAQCCFPHGSMCLIHSGTWDCKYVDLRLAELGQIDWSGPQIPQSLADTLVPTETQRSAAQHYSYLCEEQRGCSHPEGPCQRGHAVSPTLSPD